MFRTPGLLDDDLVGNRRPPFAATAPALDTPGALLRAVGRSPVALAAGVAISCALAAGLDDGARLGVLAVSSSAAAAGALTVAHRPRAAPGWALVVLPVAAIPVLGVGAPVLLVAAALLYAPLYVLRLAPRTPYAIVAAGGAAACVALAGWQTAASILSPTPPMLAAVAFLWVPGHVWSSSLPNRGDRGATGRSRFVALAGSRRAAAAVFATSLATVVASLLLVPRLAPAYALVAVPAGAYLLAATSELRRRPDGPAARRAAEGSVLYLWALLAALVLTAL